MSGWGTELLFIGAKVWSWSRLFTHYEVQTTGPQSVPEPR